jgi:thymidylate kinase
MKLKTKRIICLYGGPGCGKSTTAAGLFYQLKLDGYECEMNREYIKDWAWNNIHPADGDQSYIFAKMARKERIYMANNLDFIITDSPLILTHFYGMKYDKFEQKFNTSLSMLKNHHAICQENGYKVDHFYLRRAKPYSSSGRYQDAEQAMSCDIEMKDMLNEMGISHKTILADRFCVSRIMLEMEKDEA